MKVNLLTSKHTVLRTEWGCCIGISGLKKRSEIPAILFLWLKIPYNYLPKRLQAKL